MVAASGAYLNTLFGVLQVKTLSLQEVQAWVRKGSLQRADQLVLLRIRQGDRVWASDRVWGQAITPEGKQVEWRRGTSGGSGNILGGQVSYKQDIPRGNQDPLSKE